ncbi:hypothetical protein [Methanothrix sp.]|jgi:hypothetical protein|uniref:hypothetical protein n=1 Tax=Methanothrix sp. TaxID=90426 RepID=UPI003BB4D696
MKVVDVYSEIKDGGRIAGEENGMTGEDGTGHLWATRPAERLNIFEYFHRGGLYEVVDYPILRYDMDRALWSSSG